MTKTENYYCLILAGGKGRRLWPSSREELPKQFIDFFSEGRTLLQQTFDRFTRMFPKENIYINTSQQYLDIVREQLPEVERDNIMAEPIHRNTAPSVAWATHRIGKLNPKANIIVSPSDQRVFNEEAFLRNVLEGLSFVSHHNCLLTMGIQPTRPEPGYGYIQMGNSTGINNIYKVKAFTEKPDKEFAEMFLKSKEWYWNTGLFLSNVQYLTNSLYNFLPSVLRNLDARMKDFSIEEENNFVQEFYPSYPNLSIDYGVLEKSDNVYVMKCDFGWADLGTWHGIYESRSRGMGDNVVIDSDVVIDDCKNNIIKLPKGRLGVINGLDGYIVAEHDNVLLICKKEDSSSLILKYVNEIQLKKGDEFV
ncbi:mannose-1-phosphate guanylyltransferase [Prevotella brunnea]|uniref:Mannose-1-phosphate guanylyltransferase n=1 Tax=Prevotella brunnea TaxID=2508867 RepID=A0A5C8GIF4_9BACT|nr:sugar phosphate nucleotidyltransferase [Prevotella brunnea]TXJ61576.1 mannose-1-phosphate guanylyltransferase [Prevotella brunnea]